MNPYKLPATTYKLLIIIGPTSSGKSEMAVQLAKRFNGEIVSADSRQVYFGMNIGTGKVPGKWQPVAPQRGRAVVQQGFIYKTVLHHCIDFVNPKKQYSAAFFQRDAKKAIADILRRKKLPIICGGTAHWIDALVYNQQLPDVKPNTSLRRELEKKSVAELYKQLKKLDLNRAKNIDKHNQRRLIRALEIVITTGKPVPPLGGTLSERSESKGQYDVLWLGIKLGQKLLYQKIDKRLNQRLKAGMIKEISRLHKKGLSWKQLMDFGLEYRYVSLYLQKKVTYDEMFTQLSYAIKHYSKRQLTWWKKNKAIRWLKKPQVASTLVEIFLKK